MYSVIHFFPFLVFLLLYFLKDIYLATAGLLFSQFIQLIFLKLYSGKIDTMTKVVFVLTLLFGGLTLFFRQPFFIEMKPTVIYWVFALFFSFSHIRGKNIPELILKKNLDFSVPSLIWKRLSVYWMLSFFLLGAMNLFMAFFFSLRAWVYFKLYGVSSFFLIFSIFQVFYLWKNRSSAPQEEEGGCVK